MVALVTLEVEMHHLVDLEEDRADLEIARNREQAVAFPAVKGNPIQEEVLIGEDISDLADTMLTAAVPCHHHAYPNPQSLPERGPWLNRLTMEWRR